MKDIRVRFSSIFVEVLEVMANVYLKIQVILPITISVHSTQQVDKYMW